MKKNYFKNIIEAATTLYKGLKLTFGHVLNARHTSRTVAVSDARYFDEFDKGIATLQYPHETIPVPDTGRYRLHNEIDDCIVCDKCAKICPVDCIDIEGIKATEVIGKTSDGTPKRIHAAKFDIDMSKCCFCGLCTTVCPTECLTMTKAYDFSEFDFKDHTYSFATMTPLEILEKKKAMEEAEKNKAVSASGGEAKKAASESDQATTSKPKTAFRPKVKVPAKPVVKPDTPESSEKTVSSGDKPKPARPKIQGKAAARPIIKPKAEPASSDEKEAKVKPVIKPEAGNDEKPVPNKVRPVIKRKEEGND